MTLKQAVDQLATWSPTGITVWNFDDIVLPPPEVDLPLALPRLGGTGGEGFYALGVAVDAGRAVIRMEHVLVLRGLGMAALDEGFYGDITHVDNYLAEAADDLLLGGYLLEALAIPDISRGVEDLAGTLYHAVVFRHRWVLRI